MCGQLRMTLKCLMCRKVNYQTATTTLTQTHTPDYVTMVTMAQAVWISGVENLRTTRLMYVFSISAQ